MSSDRHAAPTEIQVSPKQEGLRLDAFLVGCLPRYSRTALRRAITAGTVSVDGATAKPAYRLRCGQRVTVLPLEPAARGPEPEAIELDVLYEDDDLLVVNKQPGMVVHPARGHWTGTLASALAYRFAELSTVGGTTRPGIVHRLDRDTSGVIVVAKNDRAHLELAAQFEARRVKKQYRAVVRGVPDRDRDLIEQPIGAHPFRREKMAIRAEHSTSRAASTQYEVLERFDGYALVGVYPQTGRTHQIRVHMTYIGCPIACDKLYAGHAALTYGEIRRTADTEVLLGRQALHAERIQFAHPTRGDSLEISAPLPDDLRGFIEELRAHRQG